MLLCVSYRYCYLMSDQTKADTLLAGFAWLKKQQLKQAVHCLNLNGCRHRAAYRI